MSTAAASTSSLRGEWLARVAEDPWIAGWWHRPFVASAAWRAYAEARAAAALAGAEVVANASSCVAWRSLPWDTEQLGLPAGRIDVALADATLLARSPEDATAQLAASLTTAREAAREAGVRHLTARVDAQALERVRALERAGFELVDGLVTFGRELTGGAALPLPAELPAAVRVRTAAPDDADAIAAIAEFVHDRFHADPWIPTAAADRLHRTWVRNSVLGSAANVVLVAEDEAGPLAFTTAVEDRLSRELLGRPVVTIVLVATAARARRRGLARRLSQDLLHWAHGRGAAVVEVGTQLRNVPAARTYVAAGYVPVATSLTLRSYLP